MKLIYEKEPEEFEKRSRAAMRDLVLRRFRNDGVSGYPKSRSGMDKAIEKAKREVIDSADRL